MKNKEDPEVRDRIHTFSDLKKHGNYPLDLSFPFKREGLENYIKNSEDIPGSVRKASSVFYVSDPKGLSDDDLIKFSNSYDLILRDATKTYKSLTFYKLSNANFSIINSYSNQLKEFEWKTTNSFYLGETKNQDFELSSEGVDKNSIFMTNEKLEDVIRNFNNANSLSLENTKSIPTVIFLLKCFDVVHCYGLEYGSVDEDNISFGMHFEGLITLKSLYH